MTEKRRFELLPGEEILSPPLAMTLVTGRKVGNIHAPVTFNQWSGPIVQGLKSGETPVVDRRYDFVKQSGWEGRARTVCFYHLRAGVVEVLVSP